LLLFSYFLLLLTVFSCLSLSLASLVDFQQIIKSSSFIFLKHCYFHITSPKTLLNLIQLSRYLKIPSLLLHVLKNAKNNMMINQLTKLARLVHIGVGQSDFLQRVSIKQDEPQCQNQTMNKDISRYMLKS